MTFTWYFYDSLSLVLSACVQVEDQGKPFDLSGKLSYIASLDLEVSRDNILTLLWYSILEIRVPMDKMDA